MPQDNKSAQNSPFEIVTPAKSKKVGKTGLIVGISIAVFLGLSIVAGVLLVRQQQTVTPQAGGSTCPAAEACPNATRPNLLQSCHPGDADGTTNDSLCDRAGRVETCGPAFTKYCCPSAGGSWTTNMTVCNQLAQSPTPTPTVAPTLTPTPTPTTAASAGSCNVGCSTNNDCANGLYCYSGVCRNPLCASDATCGCSSSATPTASSSATPVPAGTQSTPLPIPVTGTDWATYAGAGVGITAIIISLLLAL